MENKLEMMIDEEIRPLKEMCEKISKHLEAHLSRGLDGANTEEVGMVVDMIKDLCEAKEKVVKACYYKTVTLAMEEKEEHRSMYYRGQPHSRTSGRFMSSGDGRRSYEDMFMPYDMRDMDRYDHGRMYYSEGGNGSNTSSGHSGNSGSASSGNGNASMGYSEGYSRGYEDSRRYHEGENKRQSQQIEESISELSDDIMELKSQEEKEMAKQKLQRLLSRIQ